MPKYKPESIPPGEHKRICDMNAVEYRTWRGRCGGRSRSKKKLRSQLRAARTKKPGLARYHALVKQIAAEWDKTSFESVMAMGDYDYPIDDAKAAKLLAAARLYRERNP